ncbi:MAG TPA: hypothetical protein VJ998_10055 [Pseudomonadales bacterium]|nr:hypothetical protein [Pseudomonadales bacterium]
MTDDVKKIQEIFALAYEITEQGRACVFVEYAGHVRLITLRVTKADVDFRVDDYPNLCSLYHHLGKNYEGDASLDQMIVTLKYLQGVALDGVAA